ncbi:GlcG/HbpS family heme-binding protein [Novosphingobium pentaromativorans]|uniref:GlcG protein n=1 Tax=Novosphingobium pentaromativorans US6-1 TaxID=1088721 RepID=G6EGS0_9SPHN|nr:heme-binding protein [Novosphingobium pentaromativorans]AIT82079.1 GlcG protein [Novosphingobium pentaromativorans US6-1]EHJ59513.1 protein of unknown function DUF336 [Novosphingobium pentaromativorans US6-1]
MSAITLQQARDIIAASLAEGAKRGLKPLGILVLDAGGHLIAYERQDGASIGRFAVAMGKASGALQIGVSSRKIGEMAAERPTFVSSLAPLLPHGAVPAAGGVIVVDDKGSVLGAVGISGDTSDNDEICAIAGIAAAGLLVQS